MNRNEELGIRNYSDVCRNRVEKVPQRLFLPSKIEKNDIAEAHFDGFHSSIHPSSSSIQFIQFDSIQFSMSTNQDENQVYKDLATFLQSPRADVRVAALEAIPSTDKTRLVQEEGVVASIAKSCSHPEPVGGKALEALLQLSSSNTDCTDELLDHGGVGRLTEIALSSMPTQSGKNEEKDDPIVAWKKRVNWALAVLVNLTRSERGAVEMVGRSLPDEAVPVVEGQTVDMLPTKPTLELLLNRFLSNDYVEADDEDDIDYDEYESHEWNNRHQDPYQHLAGVLMNATQTEAGRRWVVKLIHSSDKKSGTTSSVLQKLLPQLRSNNPVRRRGIAGTVKNCCLDQDSAWWLLNEVKLTKHILYPLAGPEELDVDEKRGLDPDLWLEGPDKKREPDQFTRLYLVESILLLCATGRKSRESLRLSRVYTILKWTDMVEEDETVSERINECVQFLRRDEQGTVEGSSDAMVESSIPKRLALTASAAPVGTSADYDDVD